MDTWEIVKESVGYVFDKYSEYGDKSVRLAARAVSDWPEHLGQKILVKDIYGKYYGHPDIFQWQVTPLDAVIALGFAPAGYVAKLLSVAGDTLFSVGLGNIVKGVGKLTGHDDEVGIQGYDNKLSAIFYLSLEKLGSKSVLKDIGGETYVDRYK